MNRHGSKTQRLLVLLALVVGVTIGGCGGSTPTSPSPTPAPTPAPAPAPTPTPAPTPSTVSLTGTVTYTGTSVRLEGATVRILDGPNAARTTTTASGGTYRFDGLTIGNANLSAAGPAGWEEARLGVFIDGTNTLNFSIRSVAPYSRSGNGNTVFDKPVYITRVRITGSYTGSSSNFIVWCGTSLLVNEVIGTFRGPTTYDGTHSTAACTEIRVENSTGVSWSLTEQR